MLYRSPIISVLGHVDHGKTTLLDAIRGSAIAKKEAGGITQMIGASYVRKEVIESLSKNLADKFKIKLIIPGILFIDTPGHEAFTNLRERGGSIADLAVLVVDISQGFQPQTIESIQILKNSKTPFVVAANKIDLLPGWKAVQTYSFLESISYQHPKTQDECNNKIYQIVGNLSLYGFDAERFDRVKDFSKQLSIIPLSAKTKEGLAELLLLLAGLSQKFLEKELFIDENKPARGSILEVREEKGLGTTLDVIIYDGTLKEGDEIIFISTFGITKTKVRSLFEPNLLKSKEKYKRVDKVVAAAGVKILAPGLENAFSGSPLIGVTNFEKDSKELEQQIKKIVFERSELGIILRADSLGSLEAILKLLENAKIPVKSANVGNVTKNDILLASSVSRENKYLGVILAFNINILDEVKRESEKLNIPIIYSNIIYQLLERYEQWKIEEYEKEKREISEKMNWPFLIKALPGCFFRRSKPAICGVEVLVGKIKVKSILINSSGKIIGEIRSIQKNKESIPQAVKGDQVAISLDEPMLGKDICEGEFFYSFLSKEEIAFFKKNSHILDKDERELVDKIEKILFLPF